jgi:hypothetical protein
MKRQLLLVRDFWRKRWMLLTLVLLLLFAVVGATASYAISARAQQAQPQDVHDAENDHEALRTSPNSSTGSCGVERWSVKTGTDADVGLINLQSTTQTTIASLTSLPAPSTLPANNRIQPTETTVFQLHDTLTQYKLETDSDYHLILADGSGNTMIVEIPDPACVGSSSPFLSGIQNARSAFDARYTVTTSFQTANVPVTVTGVGFFDFLHGQTGVAPNGIELHAVLDIQFGSGGTPTPTPTATSTPTPTPTATSTPTPTPTGTPGTTTQLLGNAGFETGSGSPWVESSSGGYEIVSTNNPHTGTYSAWLCGYNACSDSLYQTVTLPSTTTKVVLSYWLYIHTSETSTTTCYDYFHAQLLTSSGSTISNVQMRCNLDASGWTQYTFDVTSTLSSYKGQQIRVAFVGTNDYTLPTDFYVDDVTFTVTH